MFHLFAAIKDLPRKERRAYDTAVEVFPELVRRETKIMSFLRRESFHIDKAAKRLALYWTFRKKIFKDRWLLAMTQTGNGCLTMEDVEMIRSGYVMVFTRPDQGLVALYDISRCTNFDSVRHAKIIMYVNTVFTEERTETEGFTVVYIVKSGKNPTQDLDPDGWQMAIAALPTKPKQLLVAQAFEEGKEGLLNFLAYQTARTAEFRSKQQTERLISDSYSGTLALLEEKGVYRQYLPRCLGGDFDYDKGYVPLLVKSSFYFPNTSICL